MGVARQDFLDELEKEFEYLKNGGTSYRVDIAELCLFVAQRVEEVDSFFDRENAQKVAASLLPDANLERLRDVAKMLNTVIDCFYLEATTPDEVKKKLLERKRKRKSLKLTSIS